ncbi:MAG TPA: glycosyltransferase [Candidatus Merdenecus merdavium]|nr:glycosyltransferase [Candidatus Merdenecus merdavium]
MEEGKRLHTFVICAYKESKYLEECIQSLKQQIVKSEIIMVTSTPNLFIEETALRHKIPLFINEGEGGIVQDWNFAYKMAKGDLVTIAHQDDIYRKNYVKDMLTWIQKTETPLIYFTDYAEVREGKVVKNNRLLQVKRWMLRPLKLKSLHKSRWVRRRILSFGSPICCPSVTYVKENLPEEIFQLGFRSDEDWQAWERLSKLKGSFVYSPHILMYHRIHEESETSAVIGDIGRHTEDYVMFCKFWPKPIAKVLTKIYSTSESSNDL